MDKALTRAEQIEELKPTADQLKEARILYDKSLRKFTDELEKCLIASKGAENLDAGLRRYWASVLFTRLLCIGTGVLWICPGSKVNP